MELTPPPEAALIESRKYPRTFHVPFSPGTTSDDRIAIDISTMTSGARVVITEKCDGENTCINARGVFARSHGAPTRNAWASYLWDLHSRLRGELKTLEIFGESLYAVHSIKYGGLPAHFFVFAIRDGETWLSWDDVVEYASVIDVPTVPVLFDGTIRTTEFKPRVESYVARSSRFSADPPLSPSPTEGVVVRTAAAFADRDFAGNVFKWVRKGHVATAEHWTKHWERAYLGDELKRMGHEKAAAWLSSKVAGAK